MKKINKISLIITLLIALTIPMFVRADVIISNINVFNLVNKQVSVSWDTNQPCKGYVYYGLQADNLNMGIGYGAYDYNHISVLTGLAKNQTYYYKVMAEDKNGNRVQTFVQSFSTKTMKDTRQPKFLDYKILQTTGNAVAIAWITDEATKGKITYGVVDAARKSSVSYGTYSEYHVTYIYKLKPNTSYTAEIVATDSDKNSETKYIVFNTSTGNQSGSNLTIYNIQPLQLDPNKISDHTALLSWSTNYIAQSTIYYGTKANSLKQKVVAGPTPRYDHQILLTNLLPNTTYYYKIVAEKGIYNKKIEVTGHSFMTLPKQAVVIPPQVAGDKVYSSSPDSDYDGYSDQEEIDHKYNPHGYGRTLNEILNRLNNPNTLETKNLTYLKKISGSKLSNKDWSVLVNGYTYGGYPEQAIKQAIKFGGKTVHPTIPFAEWQNSNDYQSYINK